MPPRQYGDLSKVLVDTETGEYSGSSHDFEGVETKPVSDLAEPAPEGTFEDEGHPGGPADLIAEIDQVLVEEDGKPVQGSGHGIQRVEGNAGSMRKFDRASGKWITQP